MLLLAPVPVSSIQLNMKCVVTGNVIPSDLYFFNKVNKIAALTLSSKKRLLMNPVGVTIKRGSKDTKSPTSIPNARVSASFVTFASKRTSILS